MTDFQRYQPSVQIQPTRMGNEEAQGYKSLANRLEAFANQQHQIADRDAEREGELAGQTQAAGKRSGVEFQDAGTIRGRAFNKGALMAHAAQIQIDVRSDVANYARQNPYNIEGFDSQVEGMRKGLLKEIDPILRPHAEQEINDYVSRARSSIQDNVYKKTMDESLATITTATDGIEEDILIAAREGDLEMLEKKRAQLSAIYQEGIDDNVLDQSKVAVKIAKLDEQIDAQIVIGSFDELINNKDLTAARAKLDKFKKSKNKDLLPGTKDAVVQKIKARINAAQADLNREKAVEKAKIAVKEKILAAQVKDAEKALDSGYQPPNLEQLIDQTKGTKYEVQIKEAQIHANVASNFVMLSPAQQEAEINRIKQSKDKTGAQVRLMERLEKIHNHTVTELNKDGLSLAVEQGIVPQIDPINFADPQSVENRIARINLAEAHYQQNMSPLTAAEADQIGAQFSKMTADEKIGMLHAVANNFGDHSIEVLKQLDSKNHTLFAHAGALIVDGAPEVARLAIMGNEQLKLNKGILPSDTDMMPTINSYLADVFVTNPKHQAAMIQTTKAVYAAMAADAGITDGIIDTDILETALEQVTGGVLEIEADGSGWFFDDHYKIQAPARGVTADMFENYLEGLRPGDIDEMGGVLAFSSEEAIERIQQGILVNVGQGKYLVNIGSGYLLDPTGKPFEFVYGVKGKGKNKGK